MNKNDNNQSELILDALKVVSQGLQSMQNLQSETARAHQKFLESQTEANRTLQEMMKNTQRLAEKSLGINLEPIQPASIPQYRPEPTHEPQPRKKISPPRRSTILPSTQKPGRLLNTPKIFPSPVQPDFHEGAANGYSSDAADSDSRNQRIRSIATGTKQ